MLGMRAVALLLLCGVCLAHKDVRIGYCMTPDDHPAAAATAGGALPSAPAAVSTCRYENSTCPGLAEGNGEAILQYEPEMASKSCSGDYPCVVRGEPCLVYEAQPTAKCSQVSDRLLRQLRAL
ncbi:hypothetical protein JDV02_008866 [Purpureocillium takamizusanense]|uniref:Uncharacterized protein n=1 Tax=Purpureocillium takamizusanense TaxID=2060973 RepID=A0A9Q8QMV4_9HYPO|nr:uncharacterized protein JDV02_008866 [Purpureocillium takamizusanense]UNI23023.1 hypothetical protein JDV02_008866 [Purpureocillium takamizusanense]